MYAGIVCTYVCKHFTHYLNTRINTYLQYNSFKTYMYYYKHWVFYISQKTP